MDYPSKNKVTFHIHFHLYVFAERKEAKKNGKKILGFSEFLITLEIHIRLPCAVFN